MNRKQFDKLRSALSSFCRINFFQISPETKTATGLFCTVFTEVKKTDSIEKITSILLDLGYPFIVSEAGYEMTKHLIIKF